MFSPDSRDELVKKLLSILPSSVLMVEKDIKQNIKAILQAAFDNMDLVTREEFDVQKKVLLRTRARLEALQIQVNALLEERQ